MKHPLFKQIHHLLCPSDPCIISFSAGSDSVFLCEYLVNFLSHRQIYLVYFDHGLRPQETGAEKSLTQSIAQKYGLQAIIEPLDVKKMAQTQKISLEMAGRKLRYDALIRIAQHHHIKKVATAHHQDDACESFFLKILHGSQSGLQTIQPLIRLAPSVELIRPLLVIPKSEILDYLHTQKCSFCTDSSNTDPAFTRNKVRHQLMPIVASINPNYRQSIQNYNTYLQELNQYLNGLIQPHLCTNPHGLSQIRIKKSILKSLDQFLAKYFLYQQLNQFFGKETHFSNVQIQAIFLTRNQSKWTEISVPLHCYVYADQKHIILSKTKIEFLAYEFPLPSTICEIYVPQTQQTVRLQLLDRAQCDPFAPPPANTIFLSADTLPLKELRVRNRRPFDRFKPLHSAHTKTLKKYFIDQKIPKDVRDRWPLLAQKHQILWIMGRNRSDLYPITPDTQHVLKVTIDYLTEINTESCGSFGADAFENSLR